MNETYSGDHVMEAAAPVAMQQSEPNGSEQYVPLTALQAERAERQRLQDDMRMMKDHMALLQANHVQPPPQQRSEFEGLSKEDVVTVGDLERVFSKKEQEISLGMQRLAMAQRHPDYFDVVNKYLPTVIEKNPSIANTIVNSKDLELAYYLAKNSEAYKADNAIARRNTDAERIVQNAQRPGTLSSVGQNSPISEAKRIKEMSDKDFTEMVNKNLGYF